MSDVPETNEPEEAPEPEPQTQEPKPETEPERERVEIVETAEIEHEPRSEE